MKKIPKINKKYQVSSLGSPHAFTFEVKRHTRNGFIATCNQNHGLRTSSIVEMELENTKIMAKPALIDGRTIQFNIVMT